MRKATFALDMKVASSVLKLLRNPTAISQLVPVGVGVSSLYLSVNTVHSLD